MWGSLARYAKNTLVILLANPNGQRMIAVFELGITSSGLVNPWTGMSHDISLFLSVVTEVNGVVTLCTLEDSVTGNLLIHVFKVPQVTL